MTASVNILRGDLHLLVSTAFNRGRYVLMTGGGDGQPIEITLDLRERPDDLFGAEEAREHMRNIGKWSPFEIEPGFRTGAGTDDHGPAIPAQPSHIENAFNLMDGLTRAAVETGSEKDANGFDWITREPGPLVYEFALQDAVSVHNPNPATLVDVYLGHAPDMQAAADADWVHVYDRVTRERRTLKRPEPDAVLTGLRDVAADLRDRPVAQAARGHGKSFAVREAIDAQIAEATTRGAPVEPPFGCKPRD